MKKMHAGNARVRINILAGLVFALIPSISFAERPEIDCNTLPEDEMQEFYKMSGDFGDALAAKDFDTALPIGEKAMSMCTTDSYTEYNLARIYQLTGDCPSAYYHYEILNARGTALKKENPDIYKEVTKHFKTIKSTCGDVVSIEIECVQDDVKLSMTGLPNSNVSCPFYGKILPGSYSLTATKDEFQPYNELVNVSDSGTTVVKIGKLKPVATTGHIRIRCPRNSSKFVLIDENGKRDEYVCPWEGDINAGTYKIFLGGSDESNASTLVVEKDSHIEHQIPSVSSSSCTAAPQTNGSAPYAALFMLIAGLGYGVMRRRTNRAE